MAREKLARVTTQVPMDVVHRVEAAREQMAVGGAKPSSASILRAAIERGLPLVLAAGLDPVASAEQAPTEEQAR